MVRFYTRIRRIIRGYGKKERAMSLKEMVLWFCFLVVFGPALTRAFVRVIEFLIEVYCRLLDSVQAH